jgi:hypothetical protein
MNEEEKFNIGDYVIQFKSVLIVPEISKAFFTFLKEEFSSDNWEFILGLQMIEQLVKKKNQAKINIQVKTLVNTFIEPKSKKELEICPAEKLVVLEKVKTLQKKEWNLDVSPLELFEPFRMVILNEYKNDSFKRFIRTPTCLELLEKHATNRDVLLPRLALVYNYTDDDFKRCYMDQNDIKFMNQYSMDNPNWSVLLDNKKKKLQVYYSPWNYFPNVKFITKACWNVRTVVELNLPFEHAIVGVFKNIATNTSESFEIVEYKFGDYFVAQFQIRTIQFIMSKRWVQIVYNMSYDPETRCVEMRMKSCQIKDTKDFFVNEKLPLKTKNGIKHVKAIQCFVFGVIKVTEIKENHCVFEYISTVDLDIKLPKKFLEPTGTQVYYDTMKNLERIGDRTKLIDHKYDFNELWEGLPKDPVGKLLWDLDIPGQDKQYQEKMEKRKQVFDISNYLVHFSALKRKEIAGAYYEFLKSEHNSDSWDFIMEYNTLKKFHEKGKFKQEAEKVELIMKTFIEPKSPRDLCVEKEKYTELKSNLSKKMKNYPMFKYFHKIYLDVKIEHQMDSFKRFVNIPSMNDIFAKYQHDIGVMSPIIGILSTYQSEDFNTKKVTSKDTEFISSLITNASTWDSVFSSPDMKISTSTINWFSKVDFLENVPIQSFQFEIILPYGLQQVANGYLNLNKMNKIDSNISKSKLISYQPQTKDDHEHAVVEMEMIWVWGTPMKKTNLCFFKYYHNELVFVSKPIQSQNEWFHKDKETEFFEYEIITLSELKGGSTRFQHILIVASTEKLDWKKIITERGKSFLPSLTSSVQSSKSKIVEEKEKYLELKDKDPKDAIGMLLFNLDVDAKYDEFDDNSHSEYSMNETSFIDETDTLTETGSPPNDNSPMYSPAVNSNSNSPSSKKVKQPYSKKSIDIIELDTIDVDE